MSRVHNYFEKAASIYLLCVVYVFHMIEEFTMGFVPWAERYFGKFDWTQNIIGNGAYMMMLMAACWLYKKDPQKNLWLGMSGAMWVLANSFIHISATVLGDEYSPGLITAIVLYLPTGIAFFVRWYKGRLLTWKNIAVSFAAGGFLIMLLPTFIRAVIFKAHLAVIFHLTSGSL